MFNAIGEWLLGPPAPREVFYPECPTPTTREDYITICDRKISELIELTRREGWNKLDFNRNGISLYDRQLDGDSIHTVMATAELDWTPEFVLTRVLWPLEIENKKELEPDILEQRLLECISDDVEVIYNAYNLPFPIANREFVLVRTRARLNSGACVYVDTSINRKGIPETPNFVRGVAIMGGFLLEPRGNHKCFMKRVFKIDPKGLIPSFVVNLCKTKVADATNTVRKYIAQEKAKLAMQMQKASDMLALPEAQNAASDDGESED